MGKPVSADTDESQVVELADGRLMLNMRQGTGQSCRAVAISTDGGQGSMVSVRRGCALAAQ
jgi:hypothetical protein